MPLLRICKGCAHICVSVGVVVIGLHGCAHLVFDIRIQYFHAFHILHMVGTGCRVFLQVLLALLRFRGEVGIVYRVFLFHSLYSSCYDTTLTKH